MKKSINFEFFFKENYSQFYFFALHLIDDEEVSRDIVSDSFEYALNNYGRLDVENWKTYMYSYIRNKCIDYIRHQEVKRKYIDYYLHVTSEIEESGYEEYEEKIKEIRKLIGSLTPQTRLVLRECYIHNKKYKEVADELQISVSAVRKHMVKALKVIREGIAKKTKDLVSDKEC